MYLTKSVVVYSPSKIKGKEPEKVIIKNIIFVYLKIYKSKKLTNTIANTLTLFCQK